MAIKVGMCLIEAFTKLSLKQLPKSASVFGSEQMWRPRSNGPQRSLMMIATSSPILKSFSSWFGTFMLFMRLRTAGTKVWLRVQRSQCGTVGWQPRSQISDWNLLNRWPGRLTSAEATLMHVGPIAATGRTRRKRRKRRSIESRIAGSGRGRKGWEVRDREVKGVSVNDRSKNRSEWIEALIWQWKLEMVRMLERVWSAERKLTIYQGGSTRCGGRS